MIIYYHISLFLPTTLKARILDKTTSFLTLVKDHR